MSKDTERLIEEAKKLERRNVPYRWRQGMRPGDDQTIPRMLRRLFQTPPPWFPDDKRPAPGPQNDNDPH